MVTRGNASVWFGIRAPIHVYGPISRRALDICSIIKVAYLNFNYFKYSSFLFFSLTLTYEFALSVILAQHEKITNLISTLTRDSTDRDLLGIPHI